MVFLEYGSRQPTERDRRRDEADNRAGRRETCRVGREPGAAGAVARVECDLSFESERCQPARRAAAAIRAELRRRGLATRVVLDLDVPGRCWDDTLLADGQGDQIKTYDYTVKPTTIRVLSIPR